MAYFKPVSTALNGGTVLAQALEALLSELSVQLGVALACLIAGAVWSGLKRLRAPRRAKLQLPPLHQLRRQRDR